MAMKISKKEISIRDLFKGFNADTGKEEGIFGWNGKLVVRPQYQRAFIYKPHQQIAVIESVRKGFPLNIMYWAKRDENEDGEYEVLDGQQRTLSICRFVAGKFFVKDFDGRKKSFGNLDEKHQEQILSYKIEVYFCHGSRSEKYEWFKIVNVGNMRLTEQELRNACYHGPWLEDAKRYFSKLNGDAHILGGNYLKGPADRQKYLESAIRWHCGDEDIEEFMDRHRKNHDARKLRERFETVVAWIKKTFPKKYDFMEDVNWGELYDKYYDKDLDIDDLAQKVQKYSRNPEIKARGGIYGYVLGGCRKEDENLLDLRKFPKTDKQAAYEQQGRICNKCKRPFKFKEMEGDHMTPWYDGGRTEFKNLQMLCISCNRKKGKKLGG